MSTLLSELVVLNEDVTKIEKARSLFKGMISNPDSGRAEIIAAFEQQLGVTNSTAVSYFQRIAKEAGMTNLGAEDEMTATSGSTTPHAEFDKEDEDTERELPDEELELDDQVQKSDNPNRQGVIRTVPNAHLVFKREDEEGTYNELWIYNTQSNMSDEMQTRRAILAGTDIPPRSTKSEDGSQHYTLTSMGNAQVLSITGLPQ